MRQRILSGVVSAAFLFPAFAMTAPVGIDISDSGNGLTRIYSLTFDSPLVPCGAGSSVYCSFFAGDPGVSNKVHVSPNPSGVVNHVPGGIGPGGLPVAPVPASGSFLDLTLSGDHTQLTLGVSSITFGPLDVCMGLTSTCSDIVVHMVDAGVVFNPPGAAINAPLTPAGGGSTGATVALDANRKAVFQVQNAGTTVVDLSRLSQVSPTCIGTFCVLIGADILTFDMIRYVLEVQYDPTFTSFTARFTGQTANQSLLYANLNSVPVPGALWLLGSALGVLGVIRRRAAG